MNKLEITKEAHPAVNLLINATERPFQGTMDLNLLTRWIDGIPYYPENDPNNMEWTPTPVRELDLSKYGYGKIVLKDESVNPTGTIKDRPAWEIVTLYREFALMLHAKYRAGIVSGSELGRIKIPRFTVITSGNEGRALAEAFVKYGLPPVKLIVEQNTHQDIIEQLRALHADVYVTDLSAKSLTSGDIKAISNNAEGADITSTKLFTPEEVFYDWHVFESVNQRPDQIFMPFGSGRLSACYLYWQKKLVHNGVLGQQMDPRLNPDIDYREIMQTDILCAEPSQYPSVADKLHAKFKPFLVFDGEDMESISRFGFSGKQTGIYKVSEQDIALAYKILTAEGIACEPSACAGFALYMARYRDGKIRQNKRTLIINTGRGLSST